MYKILPTALIVLAASSVSLLAADPSQAQIQITGGTIGGSLTYDQTSPAPTYSLTGINITSLKLDLAGGGNIQNFEGAATLTGSNLTGLTTSGLVQTGSSVSLSGVVTGRSLISTGQFLAFSNTPVNLQTVVNPGGTGASTSSGVILTGTLNVTGGSIQSNASLTSSPSGSAFGNAFISNNAATAAELANNPEIQARIAGNPKVVGPGSTGIGVIQGPPSRVFPMQ